MVTSLYAGLLGLLFFKLSLDTIAQRRKHQISIGMGPNNEIAEIVSAHANFVAYAVFLLLLCYLLEQAHTVSIYVLHLLAAAFTIGRLLH